MEALVARRSHVVWIDEKQARILPFDVQRVDETARVQKVGAEDSKFFEEVAKEIAVSGVTLIVGPEKDEFASFLAAQRPPITASVAGNNEAVSPTDDDLLQIARASTSKPLNPFGSYTEAFKIYEDGKHRRYSLLFAVNGGVLAILNFGQGVQTMHWIPLVTLPFTLLMGYDIWMFGDRMRQAARDADCNRTFCEWMDVRELFKSANPANQGIFSRPGRFVLAGCCLLLVVGWVLVGFFPEESGAGTDIGRQATYRFVLDAVD
jgi:hypothetical protein